MKSFIAVVILFGVLTGGADAVRPSPIDSLRESVYQVMRVLRETESSSDDKVRIRHRKLWPVVKETFDFREIGKLGLGENWDRLSVDQQTVFAHTFAELVSIAYLCDVDKEIHNVTIDYMNFEFMDSGRNRARVLTRAHWKLLALDIDYRMRFYNGRWRVYDVGVQGISLASNWRAQLTDLLKRETPAQLIERLKKQVADQKKAWKTPSAGNR